MRSSLLSFDAVALYYRCFTPFMHGMVLYCAGRYHHIILLRSAAAPVPVSQAMAVSASS